MKNLSISTKKSLHFAFGDRQTHSYILLNMVFLHNFIRMIRCFLCSSTMSTILSTYIHQIHCIMEP